MTGASIDVTLRDQQVRSALAALERIGRGPEALLRPIGVGLVANTKDRFDDGRDPQGNRWKPLHPAYREVKRGPSILRASLQLQKSIVSEVRGAELAIGTNKIYGAVHQFGATIRPKHPGGILILRTASGVAWGAAKKVEIPARPYLGISAADEDTVLDVAEGVLNRALASARRS